MVARTALLAAFLTTAPLVLSAQSREYPFRRFGTFRDHGGLYYRDMARDMSNRFRLRMEPFRFQFRNYGNLMADRIRIRNQANQDRLFERQRARAEDMRQRLLDRQLDMHRLQDRFQFRMRDRMDKLQFRPFRYRWRNGRI